MKSIFKATALSIAILTGASFSALAATAPATPVTQTVKSSTAAEFAKISNQGFDAVRDVQQARVALFEGNPQEAISLTQKASDLLKQDSVDWSQYVKATSAKKDMSGKDVKSDDEYIVINASVSLAEGFQPTKEQSQALDKASEHLKSGDEKGAFEALKLANIGVNESLVLMPLHATQQDVAKAQELLAQGKYYEANLALKNVIDSMVTDSSTVISTM